MMLVAFSHVTRSIVMLSSYGLIEDVHLALSQTKADQWGASTCQ